MEHYRGPRRNLFDKKTPRRPLLRFVSPSDKVNVRVVIILCPLDSSSIEFVCRAETIFWAIL